MGEKEDGWARFNALLEVAEEERVNYEKQNAASREKERNLRRNLSIISNFLLKIEKENSLMNESKRAAQSFELSIPHKGKRSERKKIIRCTDTLKKGFQLPNSDENHQQKHKSGPISFGDIINNSSKKSSDTGEEKMPRQKKAKEVHLEGGLIMAIPEAFYFEGHHQEKNGNVVFSYGDIFKNSSKKRLRGNGEAEMPRPKKAKKKVDLDRPAQPLPENFKNKIKALGGSESTIKLVFQKVLTATDVSFHQSRLLIPFKQVKDHSFLTNEERNLLEKRYATEEKGEVVKIPALFIDPECDEHQMNMTRWDMGKGINKVSSNYSLLTQWTKVVEKNGLKEGDSVQLWGFRRGTELGLALVKV